MPNTDKPMHAVLMPLLVLVIAVATSLCAEEPASISRHGDAWTLSNQVMEVVVTVSQGSVRLTSLTNRRAHVDYLAGRPASELFAHTWNQVTMSANDGGWTLADSAINDITAFGVIWGKRLTLTIVRHDRISAGLRLIFEIYDGEAGLRYSSFLANLTDQPAAITASTVITLDLPERPHEIAYIHGKLHWMSTESGLRDGHRNCLVRYASGDGCAIVPENNWATCLRGGVKQGDINHPFMAIDAWGATKTVQVSVDPLALQLTLFPKEEIEFMAVNLTVFCGDILDGRMSVSQHLRKRYKFHDPSRMLSTNDWQFQFTHPRSDQEYRTIIIPKAKAAGFDAIHFDDFWYAPEDGCDPKDGWTNMASLCDLIVANGMTPGHWFSLQGLYCTHSWGSGRDCADPANVTFKKRQCEEILIGKYHSAWDQVDSGLLWRNDAQTTFSHPGDSVWRKNLGMRRYMNEIALANPGWSVQTTCEIDNPKDGFPNENVGLLHLADDGLVGMYMRTDFKDNVQDLFACIGLFPLEGMAVTWGEGGQPAWFDSPLWYYQFLLARHDSIYSWPGDWSPGSLVHMRRFNDWRRNPRIRALLNEVVRPVYSGAKDDNAGPWAWMFCDEARNRALLIALDHHQTGVESFAARLRWLDPGKTYAIEDITLERGGFTYGFRGCFTGEQLRTHGLDIDLTAHDEPCVACWIEERSASPAQVLYADAAVTRYSEHRHDGLLSVDIMGQPDSTANMVIVKAAGVEQRSVVMDHHGRARINCDATTITEPVPTAMLQVPVAATAVFSGQDVGQTAGAWTTDYGSTASWLAGTGPDKKANGFRLSTSAEEYVWGKDRAKLVLDAFSGHPEDKLAACWTAPEAFSIALKPPHTWSKPYRLSIYAMDYNIREPSWARAEDVSLIGKDGKVLDVQRLTPAQTAQGTYLSWIVTGAVRITVHKTSGINAVLSGVFVNAAK